jgi:hypothetical protein
MKMFQSIVMILEGFLYLVTPNFGNFTVTRMNIEKLPAPTSIFCVEFLFSCGHLSLLAQAYRMQYPAVVLHVPVLIPILIINNIKI